MASQELRERIGYSLGLVPPRIAERIGPVAFAQLRGRFSGLLHPRTDSAGYDDGAWAWFTDPRTNQSHLPRTQREPVVVLPDMRPVETVLHELGHALWASAVVPHQRERVYWDRGCGEVTVRPDQSGLVPPCLAFTGYKSGVFSEQFAEAFAIWLLPPERVHRRGVGPDRFYIETDSVSPWGWRWGNRGLLAFFNELAGWDWDRPPRGLA